MAKVTYQNVGKCFDGNNPVLSRFDLSIGDGEFVVLVGPSGCGKSTALRLLAGLESVSEGDILIDDRPVTHATPQQRNIAMVFQNYALYPHMSVRDNLAFPLKMARTPEPAMNKKIEQIAGLLDLTELLARRPKQLSGGQRQRVAMGRALVRDPSVFLLDEPLSNLDARLRAQIRADIARLQKRLNKTTLYVTHDQVEAMTLGDRVAVMNRGRLQQVGTPETLYAHPQNTFVAKFIGSPGMNIVSAALVEHDDRQLTVRLGRQSVALPIAASQYGRDVLSDFEQGLFAGIRPEAFHTAASENTEAVSVEMSSVEYLGHESLLYFRLPRDAQDAGDEVLIARVPGQFDAAGHGDEKLYVDPADVYLFDRQGEYVAGGQVT